MTEQKTTKKVTLVTIQLSSYRVTFFEGLKQVLKSMNIDLQIVYGEIWPEQRDRNYEAHVAWGTRIRNRFFPIGKNNYVCWQALPKEMLEQSDLVIVNQENKILSHYPEILKRNREGKRIAFWGHAVGPRSKSPTNFKERWRGIWINRADWWFGYTQKSIEALSRAGFPEDRITCTNNAVDNSAFIQDGEQVTEAMLEAIRAECNISASSRIGLYCGAFYADKRLDLLFAAGDIIYATNSDFRLLIVGSGLEADYVKQACATRPWAFAVGAKGGVEKAAYFKLADMVLNPGLIGLIVLDAFCAGLPVITTGGTTQHSPEIVYLEHNVNGIVTQPNAVAYAAAVLALIDDPAQYRAMCAAASVAGKTYTQENMVLLFAQGIQACLARPPKSTA